MTGLASSTSAIRVPSASAASSSSASTVISTCLPMRRPLTGASPSDGRAFTTACPAGSRISGLSITSTTTSYAGMVGSVAVPGRDQPSRSQLSKALPVSRS